MAFDKRDGAPAANPYAPLMGRTYVGLDDTSAVTVLDIRRAAILRSWVSILIPADDHWPSAADLDTVEYVDAVLRLAPELRPLILDALDVVDAESRRIRGHSFDRLDSTTQTAILTTAERQTAREAFAVLLELTYEAYYRAEAVLSVVKRRTGFDISRTVQGAPVEPFPTERLTRVGLLSPRYREAS